MRNRSRHQHRRGFVYLLFLLLLPGILFAECRFPVGEKAIYSIHWGLVSCGTITITCDEATVDERELICIRVRVKSNWLVSTIYPVDDTVDCFIDPETGASVKLKKETREGGFICKDVLLLDRENNTAQWDSQSQNISTNYPIEAGACDAVSFLYAFRQYSFQADESCDFNIAVDVALHGITITAKNTEEKKIGETGKTLCRKYIVTPKRDDLFVRKVHKEIWLTEDGQKILARMDIKVPVGTARVVLDKYHAPKL